MRKVYHPVPSSLPEINQRTLTPMRRAEVGEVELLVGMPSKV